MPSVKVIAGDKATKIRKDAEQDEIEVITTTVTVHRIITKEGKSKLLIESNLNDECILIG